METSQKELSIQEAARSLGITLQHTYALVWAGRLIARKEDGKWLVSADAVGARLRGRHRADELIEGGTVPAFEQSVGRAVQQ